MSAAPSWPLVIVALLGRTFRGAVAAAPGFEFFLPFQGRKRNLRAAQVLILFFRPSERKTTRGALDRTRPSDRSLTDCNSPKLPILPTAYRSNIRSRPS